MADSGFNAQAMQAARNTYRRFVSLPQPPNLFKVPDSTNTTASNFPAQLGSTDPEDDKYGLRSQLVGPGNNVAGVGLAVADDNYFNYAQRKREEAMMYEFYQYVMSQADLSKPESAAWWFEHFPWMKEWRLEEIDRQAEIQKKLAKIQITGPQSEEDWMVLYLKKNGILGDQDVPLTRLNEGRFAATFKTGMFSIFSKPDNTILTSQNGNNSSSSGENLSGTEAWGINWGNPFAASNRNVAIPGLGINTDRKDMATIMPNFLARGAGVGAAVGRGGGLAPA